jgi:hypothetical protein
LLELVRYFHGYIFKYTDLIVRGHLPTHKYSDDTRKFLWFFLPQGVEHDQDVYSRAAKHLHLAFPQQTPGDIYDTLTLLLLRCIKRYDPHYSDKIREIVKIINRKKKKHFTIEYIQERVSFDPAGALKNLAGKKDYIKAIRGPGKKLIGYKTTPSWPPDQKFLNSGPVGFTFFVQMWFRYYLQDHIHEQMKTLEARAWDKMLQLEHRNDDMTGMDNGPHAGQDVPNIDGDLVDPNTGVSWAADMSMVHKQLDISQITPTWVQGTSDKLFSTMTVRERQLIYLYYVEDMPWKQIASNLGMTINQVQKIHNDILTYLQSKFHVVLPVKPTAK